MAPGGIVTPKPRMLVVQAEATGEGGPGEGGGPVLGTITEFRLSSTDPDAFNYDAKAQVGAYVDLVANTYTAALDAATALKDGIGKLADDPSAANLEAARELWAAARAAYLKSEAFLFYAGPVDGPGGPPPPQRLASRSGGDRRHPRRHRAIAELPRHRPANTIESPVRITTGLHVLEYLLWVEGTTTRSPPRPLPATPARGVPTTSGRWRNCSSTTHGRRGLGAGANNYRASVEAMDQRNALGRAFNGMTVLLGYEIPLRRIGAGLFPANENFQPSPYSNTSADDLRHAFDGARDVYDRIELGALLREADPELESKVADGFKAAEAAVAALDAPYERFLAPPAGSPARAAAEAAAKALTNLARDLRQAGNRLGILVVVPGM